MDFDFTVTLLAGAAVIGILLWNVYDLIIYFKNRKRLKKEKKEKEND